MSSRINDLGDEVWINLSGKICRFMYNSGSKDTVYRSRMGHYIGTPTTRLCAFSLDGICALPATDAVATGEVNRYNCTIRLRTLLILKLTGRGRSNAKVQRHGRLLQCKKLGSMAATQVCSGWCSTLHGGIGS